MKYILKLEQFAIFLFSVFLYFENRFNGWLFIILFFTPDLSMLGYLFGNKVGAITYNLVHHQAISILVFIIGSALKIEVLMICGLILLSHSSLDRVLGYGLKTFKGFKETHMGRIGE